MNLRCMIKAMGYRYSIYRLLRTLRQAKEDIKSMVEDTPAYRAKVGEIERVSNIIDELKIKHYLLTVV